MGAGMKLPLGCPTMLDTMVHHDRPAGRGAGVKSRGRAERRQIPLHVRSSSAVSEAVLSPPIPPQVIRPGLQLVRLPVDRAQAAVAFLQARSGGVMDLIAHFWERL